MKRRAGKEFPSYKNKEEFLNMAGKWTFWYNTDRPHFGDKMNGKTPYEKLKECGYKAPIEFCMFPPIILDNVATNIILNFSKRGGNDLCDYDIILRRFRRQSRRDNPYFPT